MKNTAVLLTFVLSTTLLSGCFSAPSSDVRFSPILKEEEKTPEPKPETAIETPTEEPVDEMPVSETGAVATEAEVETGTGTGMETSTGSMINEEEDMTGTSTGETISECLYSDLLEKYDSILYFTQSKNLNHFAFIGKREGKKFLVKDGIELGNNYLDIFDPFFSDSGNSFSYYALTKKGNIIVKDGEEIDKTDLSIFSYKYSDNGEGFDYAILTNGAACPEGKFIIDGVELEEVFKFCSNNPDFISRGRDLGFQMSTNNHPFVKKESVLELLCGSSLN